MNTHTQYMHLDAGNEILAAKEAIKEVFSNTINLKKVRVQIVPTHSALRKIKKSFARDVADETIFAAEYSLLSKGKHEVYNMDITYREDAPVILGLASDTTLEEVRTSIIDYWKMIFDPLNTKVKKIEMLEWVHTNKASANSEGSHRKGPVHTAEWNKNIGDARRGLRLKTKSREGIEWHYEGNKKVWN